MIPVVLAHHAPDFVAVLVAQKEFGAALGIKREIAQGDAFLIDQTKALCPDFRWGCDCAYARRGET